MFPDGTPVNIDSGHCYIKAIMDELAPGQTEIDARKIDQEVRKLGLPFQWYAADGRLKQELFFPNPFRDFIAAPTPTPHRKP